MQIVYDHQIFSRQAYGGISRYFCEVAKRLSHMGVKVTIKAPLYVCNYFHQNPCIPNGFHIPKLPFSANLLSSLNSYLCMLSNIFNRHEPIDIYHETYFTRADNCAANAVRFITVYDMINEKFPQSFSRFDHIRKIKAAAIKRADHIICISHNTKNDLIDYLHIDADQISVVYLSYMHHRLDGHRYSKLTRKPFLLYVGGRQPYKNATRLLKAYARSKALHTEFDLVFFGGKNLQPNELQLLSDLGIDGSQILHLSGDDTLLAQLYTQATALVYPSLYEGFGLPLLEAMSYGCPVVCSNTSSLPEIAGKAAEFCNPEETDSIQDAIEKVVFDTERSQQLIQSGLKQAKKFSWDRCARETLQVYKQALAIK
jgi:glycosyltransferase involved in cell wall biosynthesis